MSLDTSPPDPYPRPLIEVEGTPAPRLEAESLVSVVEVARDVGTVPLVVGGACVLIFGLAGLQTANFVAAQFARSDVLGGLTLAVAVIGFGSIGTGIWREMRALFSLRTVDRLRAELSGPDPSRARPALRRWLSRLPEGQAVMDAVEMMEDPAAVLALLRMGPVAALRAQSDALGRVAAVQIVAAAAAVPSPAFDGLLMAWRGVRLVRQVAALHGLRPGLVGTLALLRRTMLAAAGVMATDLAVDTLTRALLSSPLLAHVAGDVAGAGVAARRMVVLARATAVACSPVPPG
ncbi:MAG: putative rane protein [Acetobacteraceae bacterium]|nr:putative rane protein [Acetobacteraceae bacterium]